MDYLESVDGAEKVLQLTSRLALRQQVRQVKIFSFTYLKLEDKLYGNRFWFLEESCGRQNQDNL
jgi:hypothetical protein